MVKEYLADSRVLLKNAKDETFAASLRVFVQHEQTPYNVSRKLCPRRG